MRNTDAEHWPRGQVVSCEGTSSLKPLRLGSGRASEDVPLESSQMALLSVMTCDTTTPASLDRVCVRRALLVCKSVKLLCVVLDDAVRGYVAICDIEPLAVDRQDSRNRAGGRGPDVAIDDDAPMAFALLALPLDVSPFDPSAGAKPGQFKALFGGHRGALGTLGRKYRSPRRSLRVPPCQEGHPERTDCNNCGDDADDFPEAHA